MSDIVPVTTTPRVAFGQATRIQRIARSEPNPGTGRRNADAMPDGEHVVGVLIGSAAQAFAFSDQIFVVLNWFDEVRQRAPRK
ncbi:MAG: hypothetical protein Q7R30_17650 [Acidobacteriota bacterium]|nr:hypothetical protein [Acidobacteriota bacterium]